MLKLLLGTDWVANRDAVLNRIAQDVHHRKGGRILIVPEQISHNTERLLCAAAGDTTSRYAEVLTFTRLARRVADLVGNAAEECMDNGGRVVAMASAARQLHGSLKSYASVETRPEFLTGLVEAVDEFKRCCIQPGDLLTASRKTQGSFAQKLEELSMLYQTYDGLCQRGKKDPRDQMTWLLEQLEECDFAQKHVFYIDGFLDFTRQHLAIIEHLLRASENVVISLNCDKPNSDRIAFERAGDTAGELIRRAKHLGVEVEISYVEPRYTNLNVVREHLLEGKSEHPIRGDHLRLYRTESIYQECTVAAEKIFEKIQAGARYRDIAVVCADMATYRNTINMVFRKFGMPVYISGSDGVLEKSVITTVIAAIQAALNGFEQRDVFRYMKSALSPLSQSLCDRIENYAILWGIAGSRWQKEWINHPDGLGAEWTDSAARKLEELNRGRAQVVEPLLHLREDFSGAVDLKQQVHALYQFLEEISFSEKIMQLADELEQQGDNRNAQILNQLWEILLTALEQMYDVLGETVWDPDTFTRLLKLLLSQYDVGTIPPVLDSIIVGPVKGLRCHQAKHIFLLGALEGNLPVYGGAVGVLTDQERSVLREMGVPLNGGAMEGLQTEFAEIYSVFCGAEETVTVSCPVGQPSFIYRRLSSLAGGDMLTDAEFGAVLTNKLEAGAYLARLNGKCAAKELDIADIYAEIANRIEHKLGRISQENICKLYGEQLNLSASQIDRLAECRLSYFLKYGLRAKERKQATIDPAEFGTYVHAVLENTGKKIMELGGFGDVTADTVLQISREASDRYAKERFSELDTQRMTYLFSRNRQELETIVLELWQELKDIAFSPVGFEVSFGDGGEMPAISIPAQRMQAQLRGFVDRVDAWLADGKNYFRVVDYKTGKKDFDYCDIFNGLGLQMLLYLFALEQEGEELLGADPIPTGVQYFPARAPLISSDALLADEDAISKREKLWKRKGLLLSEEEILDAMESESAPNRLPYARQKDGRLSGDLADRAQFRMLKTYVFGLLCKMVDDIASGSVDPNPYTRGSSHNACTFCPYGSICHQEYVEGRRNYKAMTAQRFWEEVAKEVGNRG